MVNEKHDKRLEEVLCTLTIEMELKAMVKKLSRYNVEQLGDLLLEREDGTMRVLVSQMGGCAGNKGNQNISNRTTYLQI